MLDFGHKFKMINQQFSTRMNKDLEKFDLTFSQLCVLTFLNDNEDKNITQKKLSEAFNVKHSTMAGIIRRMSEKGLVSINCDFQNKKYKNITRTKKAKQIQKELDHQRDFTEATLVKGFSDDEVKELSEMLNRVYHNLISNSDIPNADKEEIERRFKQL